MTNSNVANTTVSVNTYSDSQNAAVRVDNPQPAYDRPALWGGIWRLHEVAKRAIATGVRADGIVMLSMFGEDPATGTKISGVHRFAIGDAEGMLNCAMAYEPVRGANVYVHWAIFPPDLPAHSRGFEKDIICQLAAVLDEDADKGEIVTPVAEPDFILETSAGNRQLFYIFDRAPPVADSKPLLGALARASGGDKCGAKPAQVFRLPGTLNCPSKTKINPKDATRKPRSPHPQPVRELKSWAGTFTNVDNLRTTLAPYWETPATERKQTKSTNTGPAPIITRFLGRYRFEETLTLFQDCRAYSNRDPEDTQWQVSYRETHPDAMPSVFEPASLNRYKTWETFAFAAGFEFGPKGRALIDAASYDPAEMDGGKFETFCRDPLPGARVVTLDSVLDWAWKRGIGRRIPETASYVLREFNFDGNYTPPVLDLPPGMPFVLPSTDCTFDDEDNCYCEPPPPDILDRAVNAASLAGKPVPERDWHVPDFIPAENVTLLYGDGGTGKSLLALQLAVATATGRPWLGRPVKSGRVIYMTAEDSIKELHIRLADVERRTSSRSPRWVSLRWCRMPMRI